MYERNRLLACVPTFGAKKNYNKEELIEAINDGINRYKNDENYKLSIVFAKLVIQRLKDYNNRSGWSLKEYGEFRRTLILIDDPMLKVSIPTILLCLSMSNEEIKKDLEYIAQFTKNYPFENRKQDPETKEYIRTVQPIDALDCYKMIRSLYNQMRYQVQEDAKTILSGNEDIEIAYECIFDMVKSENQEEKDKFLQSFDNKFSYLVQSYIYEGMYEQFRERYLILLLAEIRKIYDQKMLKRENKLPKTKSDEAYKDYKRERKQINRSRTQATYYSGS